VLSHFAISESIRPKDVSIEGEWRMGVYMNAMAEELNGILSSSVAERLLSEMGRRMYFPKGIISQSAEAGERAHLYNATVGMAYVDGEPMILDALKEALPSLSPTEAVAYAPTGGVPELRKKWQQAMWMKNPSLHGKNTSLPVVVPGLTAAVSYIADIFIEPGDTVVVPDLHWPNYRLIIEERKTATGLSYPLFSNGSFNIEGLEARLREAGEQRGKAVCVLNFPNNPAGYTPTLAEADKIVNALVRIAEAGTDLLVLCDDAYFGLQYEDSLLRESIFARLADAHENILAAKADGPTKEDFVWGFRLGFVTFAGKGMTSPQYDALVKKMLGIIRSSVSSSSMTAQNLLLKALAFPGYDDQKARYRAILESRYKAMKRSLSENSIPGCLRPLPFNSGYFMSFECVGISAEKLRVALLDEEEIGTISLQDKYLRIAFSSVEKDDIPKLCLKIFAMASRIAG
jgi:aspartate/methionine/tyrosine aminotransferase